ncbi:class I SAM-dependent methyltransferase [Cohnella cholangitidis]|uniref:Class I SAM-dependent methyltransferase n=1 Tax=Cohnella cholangitidis TaxID=2598458 RepID=A0A7G5BTG3_9BACL|nr:class I SAM-dependent methyltransferase [Cohnella cholangitidis]QMV40247.1 class I SAM-dependent methyltransferase [Cohnella cholangitidis]
MHRFWDQVIKPIIISARPNIIVEIGSLSGKNTFKLLDYCKACNAQTITIDPNPLFDLQSLKEKYGEAADVLQMFSLEALPLIEKYDLLLIDGDHNWYTVYNELKLAERMAERSGQFPIVMLHDTQWPYGRRDMYYYPESIPAEMRKLYAKRGMRRGRSKLLKSGGKNPQLYNAVYENGETNGVLTAVEDFMRESKFHLKYYQLFSNNGLGIIVPEKSPLHSILPYIIKSSKQ